MGTTSGLTGDIDLPEFDDLADLSERERKGVMLVRTGMSEEAPVEQLIRRLFLWAIVTHSSDVHISSHGDADQPSVHISIRSPQGMVNLVYEGPAAGHFLVKLFQLTNTPQGGSTPEMLDTRFKMLLPTSYARRYGLEPKVGQDGHVQPYRVSIRVAYIKTFDGYTFVCRLLDQQRSPSLDELGLSDSLLRSIKRALQEPSGLILVTGPTGSGKTTTLTAMLQHLIDGQRCVVTIEQPVEYELPIIGPVKQIEVRGDITFALALRKALRLDPEVILVGEIRDEETMEIALQAAQTGHLVCATLHANSAPETLSRALDLTVDKRRDAFRLAEVVKFVMAQRLISCYEGERVTRDLVPDELAWAKANGMGFMQRVSEVNDGVRSNKLALVEAFSMTPGIKSLVRSGSLDAGEIYRLASEQTQYETLASAGMRAVETRGVQVRDCMSSLESTAEAAPHPSLRMRLARDHGTTLALVDEAIAHQEDQQAQGHAQSIEDALKVVIGQSKEVACADAP